MLLKTQLAIVLAVASIASGALFATMPDKSAKPALCCIPPPPPDCETKICPPDQQDGR